MHGKYTELVECLGWLTWTFLDTPAPSYLQMSIGVGPCFPRLRSGVLRYTLKHGWVSSLVHLSHIFPSYQCPQTFKPEDSCCWKQSLWK